MAGNSETTPPIGAGPRGELLHFVLEVRPASIPPGLLLLPDEAQVTYESGIKRWGLRGATKARELREQITETINRQREGYFTLDEAAQIMADSRPAVEPVEAVRRFHLAHRKGHLTIHQGGTRFPRDVGEHVSDFHDMLNAAELDAWLRKSVGYGFPAHSAPATAPHEPPRDRGRRVKRKVLLSENVRRWPTIERDLKDCAKNGLSAAAKDESHGWWWEDSAREWARARGKWKDEAAAMSPNWVFHQMGR
jgi:hypothetical protein